jgi:hypothetical protein
MKSTLGLLILIGFAWVGFVIADSAFDAAARSSCGAYAETKGLTLEDANGSIGRRTWFSGREGWGRQYSSLYSCRFRDPSGNTIFIEEAEEVIEDTAAYHTYRLGGWAIATLGLVAGGAVAHTTGLLKLGKKKRDDD